MNEIVCAQDDGEEDTQKVLKVHGENITMEEIRGTWGVLRER